MPKNNNGHFVKKFSDIMHSSSVESLTKKKSHYLELPKVFENQGKSAANLLHRNQIKNGKNSGAKTMRASLKRDPSFDGASEESSAARITLVM